MLNELYVVARGLAAHGAAVVGRHPDVKDMAKGGVVRVRLREDGRPASVELVPPGGRGELWTLRDAQQNGFPGLKTVEGLLQFDGDSFELHNAAWRAAKTASAKRAELLRLITQHSRHPKLGDWPKGGHRRRIAERSEQLKPLRDDPDTAAVPAVFERFMRALDLSPPLLEKLLELLTAEVRHGAEAWLDPARAAFIGSAALAFDVEDDPGHFARDAGDPRQVGALSTVLQDRGANLIAGAAGECALSGRSAQLLEGNFPQPNLPGLGQTYLFARNRDIPAMARYGRSGTASMPIDAELSSRLSGVILELTSDERQGKTWCLIPAETGDKPDLFVATLPSDPTLPLTGVLANEEPPGTEEEESGWTAIERAGQSVVDLFGGRADSTEPQDEVRLLVLRTVDPANRKAIFDRRSTVRVLHEAALAWEAAMRNAPDWITFLVRTKKGMAVRAPFALGPLSLIGLSKRLFVNGGTRQLDAGGISAAESLALFLRDGDPLTRARRVLSLLLRRQQGLIAMLASTGARGTDHFRTIDPRTELRWAGLRSIAWIGTLLHILGRPKETYMDDAGFKLGQLLAAADAVHIGYCADMRGGDVPPTLLGNSVFATAGRHPVRALDILCGRWKPYGAWARRGDRIAAKAEMLRNLKDKKDKDLGAHMMRGLSQASWAGDLCSELKGRLDDVSVDERFRAELLLGYVAGIKPRQRKAGIGEATDGEEGDMT